VSTVPLPWEGERAVHLDQPPSLAFHVVDDAGRVITHYRSVV